MTILSGAVCTLMQLSHPAVAGACAAIMVYIMGVTGIAEVKHLFQITFCFRAWAQLASWKVRSFKIYSWILAKQVDGLVWNPWVSVNFLHCELINIWTQAMCNQSVLRLCQSRSQPCDRLRCRTMEHNNVSLTQIKNSLNSSVIYYWAKYRIFSFQKNNWAPSP